MPEMRAIGGALGRMAGRRAARNRLLHGAWSGVSAAAGTFARVLHLLFLEVTGFLFLALAIIFAGAAVREYHKYALSGKTYLAVAFTLVFLWFGISGFWRARRKRSK